MKLVDLINVFKPEEFIDDPYGRTDTSGNPLRVLPDVGLIYDKFISLEIPYKWEVVQAGRSAPTQKFPEGRAYFAGNLTVYLEDGEITVPGCSEAPSANMELAGCSTLALQNASLRSLRMAQFLYQNSKTEGAKAEVENKPVAFTPAETPSKPAYQKRPNSKFSKAKPAVSGQVDGNWTGEEEMLWGGPKYKGMKYKDVPQDFLVWAANKKEPADKNSVKELERRAKVTAPAVVMDDVSDEIPWG